VFPLMRHVDSSCATPFSTLLLDCCLDCQYYTAVLTDSAALRCTALPPGSRGIWPRWGSGTGSQCSSRQELQHFPFYEAQDLGKRARASWLVPLLIPSLALMSA
jgi:hypothetical protein